ncbi:4Fe-4S ferredoxin [Clostridium carboxidivorans P7]|uniref:4Fe-4S ferredoxin iron-sulfur binding domain protein n=1 Tax=Clostridium carboxidivorans P7 TaxID=536227 RepID=C6PTF5_9CLOT|nr:4Fe-4S binding protein [Clostridium carboxidivorans]AKN33737.1 4Fe-4S ferredoxin [Clostridium carboxidivorans P7]EET87478.1 4Fe-4S ferredoxin iron-sulfur binding domain protein [Clostridium carboxidivorans P7]EFG86663.1 4Fe-4S binding domain protein [Clostridium carboxidivorans P7]
MNKEYLIKIASDFVENSKDNYIADEIAISENVAGMKIFEAPIFAFGASDDEYFTLLKKPSAVGEHFLLPKEWLPQSKTVISFFLPFSETVKKGNRREKSWPSEEWLHGRIEGQSFINKLCMYLKSELMNAGYNTVVPALNERFWAKEYSPEPEVSFTSNWSERHAAFVCGLGTFGLSKGLITSKGMAGRFGSIITELYLPPQKRGYENVYEYCSMCGACAKKCPVNAISIENGKDHMICSKFLNKTAEKYKPRYGCGKCQIGVPCESRIPKQHTII